MYASTKNGTKAVMVGVGLGLMDGTLVSCRKRVVAVLNATAWLDGKSKSDILAQAMDVARAGLLLKKKSSIPSYVAYNLDDVMKAWNRAYKRTWVRTKKTNVLSGMKLRRGALDPIVFYLVSSHQKPQPAHEPLQGKILVDYFWRSTLEGDVRLPEVEKFVRNRKIHTVQWAMGAPHYLLTRQNCRHHLIPVRTNDVLGMTVKQVKAKYQKTPTHIHRPITDSQRYEEYRDLKAAVLRETKRKAGL